MLWRAGTLAQSRNTHEPDSSRDDRTSTDRDRLTLEAMLGVLLLESLVDQVAGSKVDIALARGSGHDRCALLHRKAHKNSIRNQAV